MDRGDAGAGRGAGDGCARPGTGTQRSGQPRPGDFWRAPRLWPGEPVAIFAGGPSLDPADVALCRGRARCIAVNDAWRLAPWADALYACDTKWWLHHEGAPGFQGLKVGLQGDLQAINPYPDVRLLRWRQTEGLETDPAFLATGANSGYQALGLALHLAGPGKRILLGYDCGAAADGQLHWFGRHPAGLNNPTDRLFAAWAQHFAALAPLLAAAGCQVVNASRATSLDCFPRVSLAEAFEDPSCSR